MLVWSRQQIAFAQERFEVRALLGKMSHLTESELRFVVETVATQRHDHDHVMDNDSSHQLIFNCRQAIPHRLHHGLVGLWISYGN